MAETSTSGEEASTSTVNGRFQAEVLAVLLETIGGKLRRELEPLKKARNEALRTIDRDHPDPYSFFLQHSISYMSECDKFLLGVKPILHGAVDDMLEELKSTLPLEKGADSKFPNVSYRPANFSYHDSLERTLLSVRERLARSADRSTGQEPRGNAGEPPLLDTAPSVTEAGSPIAAKSTSTHNKRPAPIQDEDPEPPRPLKKKTTKKAVVHDHKTTKKINSAKKDECVFRHEGFEDFYVLRCNAITCKKRAGVASSETIYFREYPFGDSASWKHFTLPGHQVKDENEAFIKYAAKAPCRTPTPQQQPQYPFSPLSPLCFTTQDKGKGKQPERVFTVDDEVAEAATAACGYWDRKLAFQNLHRSPFGKGKGKGVAQPQRQQQEQEREGNGEEAGDDGEAPGVLMTGVGGCHLLWAADVAPEEAGGGAGSTGNDSTTTSAKTAERSRGTSETLRSGSVPRSTAIATTVHIASDNNRRRSRSRGSIVNGNGKGVSGSRREGDGEDRGESESESEEEIPPLEKVFNRSGRRQKAKVDYREKPPTVDEFE
ncbi:hypothetical protein SLS62_001774 [Diatrype stigma]|uniref:Uncharacterized protein n=1 Tax=Diatrype stigma TaxID=117547 RepID=A0AAN9UZ07_9PEZI